MARKLYRATWAVLVLAMSLLAFDVGAPSVAVAQMTIGPDGDWTVGPTDGPAGWITQRCADAGKLATMPASLLGTTTGSLAWAGGGLANPGTYYPVIGGGGSAGAAGAAGVGAGGAGAAGALTAPATLSGGTVGAAALVFAGALCGTVNTLTWGKFAAGWLLRDKPTTPPLSLSGLTSTGLVACESFGITAPATDKCFRVSWASLPTTTPFSGVRIRLVNASVGALENGGSCTYSSAVVMSPCQYWANGMQNAWNASNMNNLTVTGSTTGPGSVTLRARCYEDPTCMLQTNQRLEVYVQSSGEVLGTLALDPALQSKGQLRKIRATITCQTPAGDIRTLTNDSPGFWDNEQSGPGDWRAPVCEPGEVPVKGQFRRFRVGDPVFGTWPGEDIFGWDLPAPVKANPTTLQCFVVGVTNCPIYETSPSDPNPRVGGATGVAVPRSDLDNPLTEVLQQLADVIDEERTRIGTPAPTTTTPGATTTTTPGVTTTTVASDPCAGGAPSSACPPPSGPDAEDPPGEAGSECFPSGWGWLNPVEWVLKPVKCALLWAFWDADSAQEMSDLWDGTGEPWAEAIVETAGNVEFSADAGPCIPIEDVEEVCTSDVLGLELPGAVSSVIAAVFAFALVFEVVGLFARVTGG